MTGWRIAVKEQRILKQKKIVGLQIFSMPVLKFGDIWENFGRWKKLFALEMASHFLQNKWNFAWCKQGLNGKKLGMIYVVGRIICQFYYYQTQRETKITKTMTTNKQTSKFYLTRSMTPFQCKCQIQLKANFFYW